MSGFLLDTNIPSELIRARPEPRVGNRVYAKDEQPLYLSAVSIGFDLAGCIVGHLMAIVTPARLDTPPTVSTRGTALPVGALSGISRLIWISPAYTNPAKTMLASGITTPPRLTLTGSRAFGKGGPIGCVPS